MFQNSGIHCLLQILCSKIQAYIVFYKSHVLKLWHTLSLTNPMFEHTQRLLQILSSEIHAYIVLYMIHLHCIPQHHVLSKNILKFYIKQFYCCLFLKIKVSYQSVLMWLLRNDTWRSWIKITWFNYLLTNFQSDYIHQTIFQYQ